ncbi:low affinity iron permease family protein [Mesorhizobium sp. M0833]|uniref:low affinity iron permease family protein n=1 Tax=Mesorhizobium sp. M0833 TaxID=2957009 RepID=UPI00333C1733
MDASEHLKQCRPCPGQNGFDSHGVATLAIWAMTLFIQLAEHRDTQAVHAKMDELLRAVVDADNETAKIDKKKPKEIEAQRQQNSNENEPSQGTHYIPGRIPPCPELSLSLVRS